jgi:hypothetical protein
VGDSEEGLIHGGKYNEPLINHPRRKEHHSPSLLPRYASHGRQLDCRREGSEDEPYPAEVSHLVETLDALFFILLDLLDQRSRCRRLTTPLLACDTTIINSEPLMQQCSKGFAQGLPEICGIC